LFLSDYGHFVAPSLQTIHPLATMAVINLPVLQVTVLGVGWLWILGYPHATDPPDILVIICPAGHTAGVFNRLGLRQVEAVPALSHIVSPLIASA